MGTSKTLSCMPAKEAAAESSPSAEEHTATRSWSKVAVASRRAARRGAGRVPARMRACICEGDEGDEGDERDEGEEGDEGDEGEEGDDEEEE